MAGLGDGAGAWDAAGAAGAAGLGPGRVAVRAVAPMADVSEGLGLGEGVAAGAAPDAAAAGGFFINCLIRSTIVESRLASALTLTSSPQRWMRSSNSWLFRPSSFANSWTRVDNGNSSWMGRPDSARPGGSCSELKIRPTEPPFRARVPGPLRGAGECDQATMPGPCGASWLMHFRIASLDPIGREGFRGWQGGDIPPRASFAGFDLLG